MRPVLFTRTRIIALRTVLLVALSVLPASLVFAAPVTAVEFYNAGLDHYFVTANTDEISKLDTGYFSGWTRTGHSFGAYPPDTSVPVGASPVCRFYGKPEAGLNSHFYSASPAECSEVKQKFSNQWQFEADDVFYVYLPDETSGACPAGTASVYRTWNNRIDSNHRYTADPSLQSAMLSRGYVAEGYGNPPVIMCAPQVDVVTSVSMCQESNGFFSSGCDAIGLPYGVTGQTQASIIGSSEYTIATFHISATGGPVTITNVTAFDANHVVAPLLSNLHEGQVISAGQTIVFELVSPLTAGRQADLHYSFHANNVAVFSARYLFVSN